MIITGMNRFFAKHGRIAFFLIAVVISFAFVLFMTGQSIFDLFSQRSRGSSTVLILGRKVTQAQRMDAVDSFLIQQVMTYPNASLKNTDYSKWDQIATRNLMLLYAAQDRGIAIGDDEVKKYIKTVPEFQTKGKFDNKKFNEFVEKKLNPSHFNKADLDAAVREKLAIEQLSKNVTESIIISDEELRTAFFNINEKAKVKTNEFKTSDYIKNIKVDEKAAKAYYEANKKTYMTQPAVKIQVVRFEYGKYRVAAWKKITDKEIETYYNNNKYLYKKTDKKTKKKLKDPKKTKPVKPEYTPLKQVAGKIKNKLAERQSKTLAAKAASQYSEKIYNLTRDIPYNIKDKQKALEKCQTEFAKFAKENKKKIFTTPWIFKGATAIKKLGNEPKLVQAAETRFLDDPISDAVKGNKAAFVFILIAQQAPQPEAFDKYKSKIFNDLKKSTALIKARENARNIALKIGEDIDKGKSFTSICKKLKIKFNSYPMELKAEMQAYMLPGKNGKLIHSLAFDTPQKQLAQVRNTPDGALLVYVESKTFPSEKDFKDQKTMFAMLYKMKKKQAIWFEFARSLAIASEVSAKK